MGVQGVYTHVVLTGPPHGGYIVISRHHDEPAALAEARRRNRAHPTRTGHFVRPIVCDHLDRPTFRPAAGDAVSLSGRYVIPLITAPGVR